jgi:hypothetical protein
MADVRKLFFKVAPQFIYQFFVEISSTPHNLNIFPVDVPEEFRSRYTHAYYLHPLSLSVNAFFVPGPASTNDVQSWFVHFSISFFVQEIGYPLTEHILKVAGRCRYHGECLGDPGCNRQPLPNVPAPSKSGQ